MNKTPIYIYHEAFKQFDKSAKDSKTDKFNEEIFRSERKKDVLDSVRFSCVVEEDWLEAFESLLPYVEKAIKEDRQFILKNGNVVLIEKAKKISKTSVEHLAHHSELVTHEPTDNGDIIPDKLYVTENENNFAIYENRFLYLLLLNAQDFVGIRYSKISKAYNSIKSDVSFDKKLTVGNREIKCSVNYSETAGSDDFFNEGSSVSALARIQSIQRTIVYLLNTPLMQSVSKAPLIKTPIVKTNVLRMNPNFKKAVELFDFINSYTKQGYETKEEKEHLGPFPDDAGHDFARVVEILSYLTYKYGCNMKNELEKISNSEEKDRKLQELSESEKKIAKAEKDMIGGKLSPKDYSDLVRTEFATLAKNIESSVVLGEKCKNLENEMEGLVTRFSELKTRFESSESENINYKRDMQNLTITHEKELAREKELFESQLKNKEQEIEKLNQKLAVLDAQLRNSRMKENNLNESDSIKCDEDWEFLEKEYEYFGKYLKSRWKVCKKEIRLNTLWKRIYGWFKRGEK